MIQCQTSFNFVTTDEKSHNMLCLGLHTAVLGTSHVLGTWVESVTEVEQAKVCPAEYGGCSSVSIAYVIFAFWDGSLGWFLGWKLWNWPEITKPWVVKEPLNNNYFISLLTWTWLCAAAWRGAAGTQLCCLKCSPKWIISGTVALHCSCHSFQFQVTCFKVLYSVLCLAGFSSSSGAACGIWCPNSFICPRYL